MNVQLGMEDVLTFAAITLEVINAPAEKDTLWQVTENRVLVRNQ